MEIKGNKNKSILQIQNAFMTPEELKELLDTVALKKLSFDGSEFKFEFANGVAVSVGKMSNMDCAEWDISSKTVEHTAWHARKNWFREDIPLWLSIINLITVLIMIYFALKFALYLFLSAFRIDL
jgi:hypothetical protein